MDGTDIIDFKMPEEFHRKFWSIWDILRFKLLKYKENNKNICNTNNNEKSIIRKVIFCYYTMVSLSFKKCA